MQKKYYWIDDGTLDKLVLSSPCVDFPRSTRVNIFHVGLMVDLNRAKSTINWDIFGERPIVYCSLGTQVHKDTDRAVTFFSKLISVFSSRSDVSLIVSMSAELRHRLSHGLTRNIHLMEDAPQLDMLKRCEFMITHGGLGSVKECIRLAVPMLVFPLNPKVDQAGNAARVHYHKIGLRGDMNQSARAISDLVEAMLTDQSFKRNIVRMQRTIIDEEKQDLFFRYLLRRIPSLSSLLEVGNDGVTDTLVNAGCANSERRTEA